MKKKVKLVWQFSGTDALKIADHHLVLLKEYIQREKIIVENKGVELINKPTQISGFYFWWT